MRRALTYQLPGDPPVTITGDHVFAVLLAAGLVMGLGSFFRRTRVGVALRATGDNPDAAAVMAVPVVRLRTLAWAIAGLLSAIAVFLRSPLVGIPAGGLVSPIILLYALTAAMVARLQSMPIAFGAGLVIGVIDQSAVFGTASNDLASVIMLAILLLTLLLQRRPLVHNHDADLRMWPLSKEIQPVPEYLRRAREVYLAKALLLVLVAMAILAAPFVVGQSRTGLATLVVIYAMVAVSLVILTGWAGQLSLGQFAFVGIGAAVGGGLAADANQDFFVTLFAGALVGAVAAAVIGLPALRGGGTFLAVTTLAFGAATTAFFLDPQYFGWVLPEDFNRIARPLLWERINLTGDRAYYYFCVVFLLMAVLAARSFRRNRSGRVLIAIRENPTAAPALAISVARNRLAAFAVSGAIAAAAGVLLAYQQNRIDPETYGVGPSIDVFAVTVVGGAASVAGAVAAAVGIYGIRYFEDLLGVQHLSLAVTGPGLVLILLLLPGGLAQAMSRVRDWFLHLVAQRHGITGSP